ncbi:MAG: phage holin family protein [Bacteroidota bacterium]
MTAIATILINAVALWLGAKLLRGVEIGDFMRAIIVGAVLGLLNWTLGRVLNFLTAPLIFITLGFFALVVDAIILMIVDYFMKGLKIKNFWWALALAVIVSAVNIVTKLIF